MSDPSVLGHLLEGIVERDPISGHFQIMTVGPDRKAKVVDLSELLSAYEGKEVRLTLASFENLATLAEMVERQGGGAHGVMPEELPGVSFDIRRR